MSTCATAAGDDKWCSDTEMSQAVPNEHSIFIQPTIIIDSKGREGRLYYFYTVFVVILLNDIENMCK